MRLDVEIVQPPPGVADAGEWWRSRPDPDGVPPLGSRSFVLEALNTSLVEAGMPTGGRIDPEYGLLTEFGSVHVPADPIRELWIAHAPPEIGRVIATVNERFGTTWRLLDAGSEIELSLDDAIVLPDDEVQDRESDDEDDNPDVEPAHAAAPRTHLARAMGRRRS